MYLLHKPTNLYWSLEITQGDRVDGEACQFFNQGDQCLKIFFNGDVERISIFEIDRN